MKIKKILLSILLTVILVFLIVVIGQGNPNTIKQDESKLQVVVSNFASYDFLRAIIGENDNIELTFLIGPGKESHSYEPTSQDLIKMQNADMFVYIGEEIEKWAEKIVPIIDKGDKKIVKIADFVEMMEEQEIDGAEDHDHEEDHDDEEEHEIGEYTGTAFEEHVWTSPTNAIKMVEILEKELSELDEENSETYKQNADSYIAQIEDVKAQIQEVVDNRVRNRLVFGDKMPMQYFIQEYGLEVSAAFNGCSTETDPGSSTIAYLANKVKEENIPVVLYCELGTGKIATTIAEEAGNGAVAMQMQTLHNLSKDDFQNGETWVSLMTRNIEVLKKALQ